MKRFERLLALLLALLTVFTLLIGCANTEQPADETTVAAKTENQDSTETEDPNAGKYDSEGYLISDLPDLDFKEETVTVLYWSDVEMQEYESDGQNGQLVNDAIFTRNTHVEDQLNVRFAWTSTPGNNKQKTAFAEKVGQIYKSGDADIDLISAYSRTTAICAELGYCKDLNKLKYLNFSNPWWPESLTKIVPINGKIYFASGDASINVLHFMYGVYYNKDAAANLNFPNLYELVDTKKWTIDKMIELCKDVYIDLDNDNAKSSKDFYGIASTGFHTDAFYTGSGLKLVEQDPEKILVISEDFYSQKSVDLCTKLGAWYKTNDAYMGDGYEEDFVNGNVIFSNNRCYMADRKLHDVTFKYGILPTPLYDEEQENYVTVEGNPFSLYAVFVNSKDADRAAAVLEAWAAEAYRTTTPAQYELNMKAKYSEVSDDSRMYEIIKTTVCFDIGRLFNAELADMTDIFFNAVSNNANWAIQTKSNKKVLPKRLSDIVANFEKLSE